MPTRFMGLDSGIRGGGGLVVIEVTADHPDRVIESRHIERLPTDSEIQMIVKTVQLMNLLWDKHAPITAIGREDHNFLGMPERMSRNILRRINGAVDFYAVVERELTPGEDYLAFPPGSWKAVAGIPGDIGKTVRGQEKGKVTRKRKKASPKDYLADINSILMTNYATTDEADAHGIAVATARVWGARRGVFQHVDTYPTKVQNALFDRDKCLGRTLHAFKKECDDDESFRRLFGQFVRTYSP